MLRELRSKTISGPVFVCMIVGHGLNLGSIGWLCVLGCICLWTPLKLKAKFYLYLFFWAEVLMRAMDFQKGCEQRVFKPLFLDVANMLLRECVFPLDSLLSSCGICLMGWQPFPHSLLPLLPPGSKDRFKPHCWGCLGCPQIPLEVTWSGMSQSWKVHLQRGGGILAWMPVLSCIWCVVHPSL